MTITTGWGVGFFEGGAGGPGVGWRISGRGLRAGCRGGISGCGSFILMGRVQQSGGFFVDKGNEFFAGRSWLSILPIVSMLSRCAIGFDVSDTFDVLNSGKKQGGENSFCRKRAVLKLGAYRQAGGSSRFSKRRYGGLRVGCATH